MKKIIHLSDLHVGAENCGYNLRKLIDNISYVKEPANNYIILITGDIVDNANDGANIEEALDALNRLKEKGYEVLLVPGNHDYGNGIFAQKKFIQQFKNTFFKNKQAIYPKLDIIDGIAFIGLDTMAEEVHWHDSLGANGEIGDDQLDRLDKMLKQTSVKNALKKVVYLHHHPFDYLFEMILKDADKLQLVIENKVDVLLFGHYHNRTDIHTANKYNGKWGIPRCYDAGSSTHKNGDIGHHRVIDLSLPPSADYDGKFI